MTKKMTSNGYTEIKRLFQVVNTRYLIRNYTIAVLVIYFVFKPVMFSPDKIGLSLFFILSTISYPFAKVLVDEVTSVFITGTYIVNIWLLFFLKGVRFILTLLGAIPLSVASYLYIKHIKKAI